MLVLTRKSNQSIMIGDEIEISVLSVMGDKVRIGIQAPRSVPVYRREVYVAIQSEREDARRGELEDASRGELENVLEGEREDAIQREHEDAIHGEHEDELFAADGSTREYRSLH
jgi:carbon storage regulator